MHALITLAWVTVCWVIASVLLATAWIVWRQVLLPVLARRRAGGTSRDAD